MTAQVPQEQQHVLGFLPAYVNGTLEQQTADRVHVHLLQCETCQQEYSSWEALKDAAQFAIASAPAPSMNIMSSVWAKIDAAPQKVSPLQWFLNHILLHFWLIFKAQVRIIHRSIWIASALVILFGGVLASIVLYSPTAHNHWSQITLFLSLITTITAASGSAFIYGTENDASLELTLATPTSIRFVMLSRLVLVVGYDFMLSFIVSFAVSLIFRGSLWDIMQLWVGPMLLLSSITLALSLLIGSWLAMLVSFILEFIQALPLSLTQHMPALQMANPVTWQTSPTVLLFAVLFILFAVFYAPRQPNLSE
ncbi:MAG TPA: zf-HC2 domain-containing protein [Ktedonobacteraceae bacterium]|nr:zf-HC2 domain-containing protein [Ktedonobacteraceae bacterium]